MIMIVQCTTRLVVDGTILVVVAAPVIIVVVVRTTLIHEGPKWRVHAMVAALRCKLLVAVVQGQYLLSLHPVHSIRCIATSVIKHHGQIQIFRSPFMIIDGEWQQRGIGFFLSIVAVARLLGVGGGGCLVRMLCMMWMVMATDPVVRQTVVAVVQLISIDHLPIPIVHGIIILVCVNIEQSVLPTIHHQFNITDTIVVDPLPLIVQPR